MANIIYQRHESMDGPRYPKRLKGDEILIEARIIAIADVVKAMLHADHTELKRNRCKEIEKNKVYL
ncbi:MAG: HD domain-containing protein [Proteobacteria bacterium]|nr:HD domain-containing protein [Pseudomonadota bacterium]